MQWCAVKLDFSALERLHPRSLKHLSGHLASLVRGRLWLKVLIGMGLGVGVGILLGPSSELVSAENAAVAGDWLALPGQVFLGLVQMIVLPLVFASIIRGLAASENLEQLKKLGSQAVGFFVVTTTIAIVLGIGLALLVRPGEFVDAQLARSALADADTPAAPALFAGSLPDAITNLLPRNPLGAMVDLQMLQVVLFAIFIGVALLAIPAKQSAPLLGLLESLQAVSMVVVRWAMLLAPFAVFGLMAQLTSRLGIEALAGLSVYVGTVLAGLLLLLALYLILVALVARRSPWAFMQAARELQLLAFSTSSSAAVMPLSIQTAEEKLRVRPSIAQFVIPLGATINMNGTALYQGVATVFLAQVFGIDLGTGQLVLVVVTAVAASIGSPATPGVGIVILSMVLGAAGVPAAGLGLIIGVDRILDMSRTAVNVTGDLVAVTILDRTIPEAQVARVVAPAAQEAQ